MPTNQENTPSQTPKWRLLEPGEITRLGDQFITRDLERKSAGSGHDGSHGIFLRRMTPAQEHGEETLAALREFIGLPHDGHEIDFSAAEAAIAKAEGK